MVQENKEKEYIRVEFNEDHFHSFALVESSRGMRRFTYWLYALFGMIFLILLLPWTQNVQANGKLTTVNPSQQPQKIYSTISGRIEQWNVSIGEHVSKGDTLAQISEVKSEYFDPNLVERTQEQLTAKKSSLEAYYSKINALNNQLAAITAEYGLKLDQLKNKVEQYRWKVSSDSSELETARTNLTIAQRRLERTDSLYTAGIKSLADLETYKLKVQETTNKVLSAQNKYLGSQNEYINSQLALRNAKYEYNNKLSKAQSDLFSAQSMLRDAEGSVAKLENQLANYTIRRGFYFITAPQDCYIANTYQNGIGEIVKEGNPIAEIVPSDMQLAVELYVRPVDLPLIQVGEQTRIIFDGWPSLVFSGWPNTSFGTFGGEVYAIDKNISKNGKYRILLIPDITDDAWPNELRIGSGAKGTFLLNDVPVYYELWRQINGFPPEYYDGNKSKYELDESIDKKYHTK